MSIRIICPKCEQHGKVRSAKAGKKVRCTNCGATVRVPVPKEAGGHARKAHAPSQSPAHDAAHDEGEAGWQDPTAGYDAPPPSDLRLRIAGVAGGAVLVVLAFVLFDSFMSARRDVAELRAQAKQGVGQAQYDLAIQLYTGAGLGVRQDSVEALEWFQEAAKRSHPDGQYFLAGLYERGEGVAQDDVRAFTFYHRAARQGQAAAILSVRRIAEKGYLEAQTALGKMYDAGTGVPQDYTEAVAWYTRAAEQGAADAQFTLAQVYVEGKGVPPDPGEAVEWFRRAAEQDHLPAQYQLGLLHAGGPVVIRDPAEAATWFLRAAEGGHAPAQFALGKLYYRGRGVTHDPAAALTWFTAAAKQQHVEAMFRAGGMHYNGQGTAQNFASAISFFKQAAMKEHARANLAMGIMYANHQSVAPQDHLGGLARPGNTVAYWLRRAAALGGWPEPLPVLVKPGDDDLYLFSPDDGLIVRNTKDRSKFPPPSRPAPAAPTGG